MPTLERIVTVDSPLEVVWARLEDFRSSRLWDPCTVGVTRTSGDGDICSTYRCVLAASGADVEIDYVVTDHVEGRRLRLHGDTGPLDLRDTLTVAATARGRTAVTYLCEILPKGALTSTSAVLPAALEVRAAELADSLAVFLGAP